jgi:hypothetical protein
MDNYSWGAKGGGLQISSLYSYDVVCFERETKRRKNGTTATTSQSKESYNSHYSTSHFWDDSSIYRLLYGSKVLTEKLIQ